jgi:hypothetical protein
VRGLLAALAILCGGPALAHHPGPAVPGIAIASLGHGQMQAVARHGRAIVGLAGRQGVTDEPFRRLLTFVRLQRTYCLWGLMPGSVADEASPFNECSHAYLAGALALLGRLEAMPAAAGEAAALRRAVDLDMIALGTASELCQYSANGFATDGLVMPHWRALPGHPPSLAVVAGLVAAAGIAPVAWRRRPGAA